MSASAASRHPDATVARLPTTFGSGRDGRAAYRRRSFSNNRGRRSAKGAQGPLPPRHRRAASGRRRSSPSRSSLELGSPETGLGRHRRDGQPGSGARGMRRPVAPKVSDRRTVRPRPGDGRPGRRRHRGRRHEPAARSSWSTVTCSASSPPRRSRPRRSHDALVAAGSPRSSTSPRSPPYPSRRIAQGRSRDRAADPRVSQTASRPGRAEWEGGLASLLVIGVSTTARVDLERLSLDAPRRENLLAGLCGRENIAEAIVVSTCNRTEVYVEALTFHRAVSGVTDLLLGAGGDRRDDVHERLYLHFEDRAIAHAWRPEASTRWRSARARSGAIAPRVREGRRRAGSTQHSNTLFQRALPRRQAHPDRHRHRCRRSLLVDAVPSRRAARRPGGRSARSRRRGGCRRPRPRTGRC